MSKELLPSSGGQEWGSKYVDFYYEEFLNDFLGDKFFKKYKSLQKLSHNAQMFDLVTKQSTRRWANQWMGTDPTCLAKLDSIE